MQSRLNPRRADIAKLLWMQCLFYWIQHQMTISPICLRGFYRRACNVRRQWTGTRPPNILMFAAWHYREGAVRRIGAFFAVNFLH
jgi:hypothetical protein